MSSSPRKSFVAALLAALPRGLDDGAVSVVHAGESVTVTLTAPGAARPLVTATVRRPAPASDADRQLAIPAAAVPARRPSVPPPAEAPTTTATATPVPVPPGRELRLDDTVWRPIPGTGASEPWRVAGIELDEDAEHVVLRHDGETRRVGRDSISLDSSGLWQGEALAVDEGEDAEEPRLVRPLAPLVVPPIDTSPRVLRLGDAVYDTSNTMVGTVDAIDGAEVVLFLTDTSRGTSRTVSRASIRLTAAGVWELTEVAAPTSPVVAEEPELRVGEAVLWGETKMIVTGVYPWNDAVFIAPPGDDGAPPTPRDSRPGGVDGLLPGERAVSLARVQRAPASVAAPTSPVVAEETPATASAEALPTELFSIEIDGAEVDGSAEDSARWADRHGLRWVCGGCLFWHVEGGASSVKRLRMVSSVPAAHATELLDLCAEEGLEARVTPHKTPDHSLLRAGSFVFEDSTSDVLAGWAVTETPKRGELIRLARGATESSVDLARLRRFTNGSGAWRIMPPTSAKPSKGSAKAPAKKAPAKTPVKASTATPAKAAKKSSEVFRYLDDRVWDALPKHALQSLTYLPSGDMIPNVRNPGESWRTLGPMDARAATHLDGVAARHGFRFYPAVPAPGARWRDLADVFDDRTGASLGACLVMRTGNIASSTLRRPKGSDDAAWLTKVKDELAGAELDVRHARLYSKAGACLWDSRDGGEPSTGPAKASARKPKAPKTRPAPRPLKTDASPAANPVEKIENPPVRVFVVRDEDLYELQKGLPAFDPAKDSYAGACGGGFLRPLAQMHTSRVDSKDVAALLNRLENRGLPYLDFGKALRDDLSAHAPDRPFVRAAWNVQNPNHAVQLDGVDWQASADPLDALKLDAPPVGLPGNLASLAVTNRYTVCVREGEGNAWSRIGEGHVTKGDAHQSARAAVMKHGHERVAMIDPDGALVRLPKPAAKPATQAAPVAPRRHGLRHTPPRDDAANARATRGAHTAVGRTTEGAWVPAAMRDAGETHPAWHARARELLGKYARVRVYDSKPRCVWDSADAQGQSGGAS